MSIFGIRLALIQLTLTRPTFSSFVHRIASAAVIFGLVPMSYAATPIHYYDFANGATDLIGGKNGLLVGGANTLGGTLNLNGVDAFVDFNAALIPTSGSFTVAFAAKPRASQLGAYFEMISQGNFCPCFYLGGDPSGGVRVGDLWQPRGINTASPGIWTNYAVVVDSGSHTTSLYIDGALASSANFAIPSGHPHTRFGSQYGDFGQGGGELFDGSIDNVGIYSVALTAGEVAALGGGLSQSNPLPPTTSAPGNFTFTNVNSGLWFDPPITSAIDYTLQTPGDYFTSITLPTGFNSDFTISSQGNTLGTVSGGKSFTFSNPGVTEFMISGISPSVDLQYTDAFPVQIYFSDPTGNSFNMSAVPEPSTIALFGISLAGITFGKRRNLTRPRYYAD